MIVGDASRNAVGTGGEHGHSRDTIAQVGHWQGSLKSPGTIQLWSCSVADTALPARATPGSCTTMRNRLPFCTEHSGRKPTHSFLLCPHPLHFQLGDSLRAAESSLAFRNTAVSDLTKEQQICYAYIIFLLALELLWQEKGNAIVPKRLRSELHTCTLSLVCGKGPQEGPHLLHRGLVTCSANKMYAAGNFCLLSPEN